MLEVKLTGSTRLVVESQDNSPVPVVQEDITIIKATTMLFKHRLHRALLNSASRSILSQLSQAATRSRPICK